MKVRERIASEMKGDGEGKTDKAVVGVEPDHRHEAHLLGDREIGGEGETVPSS